MWRCKGRLHNSTLSENAKHPILLPTRHRFTSLMALDCHKCVLHCGVKGTLTEIRTWFWILRGPGYLRRLLRRCTVCARFNALPYKAPEKPPLPNFRVQEYPPFSYIGVDYAGPLFVCKPDSKIWISLFTCCGTRALHLDLVLDMTSDSFIRCFKRFMARRGTPLKIISDNSKTFKSANKDSGVGSDSEAPCCSRIFC